MDVTKVINLLWTYKGDKNLIDRFISFIQKNQHNFWDKNNEMGHITVSGWIISEDCSKALLIHHLQLKKWFQIGGHIEMNDISPLDAIRREAKEEVGVKNLKFDANNLFHIAIYNIPEVDFFPSHFHYDFIFIAKINSEEPLLYNKYELDGIQWVKINEIEKLTDDRVLKDLIQKTLRNENTFYR